MPRRKSTNDKKTSIKTGNISGISGEGNIAGGDITTNKTINGLSAADVKLLFDQLFTAIEANSKVSTSNKEDIKADVKDIQAKVTEATENNEKVDESFLARMAPDVLDVIVATLGSPLAGLGVAAKKIAEKAKEETTQT